MPVETHMLYDEAAERGVVGGLMLDPFALDGDGDGLKDDDFNFPKYRRVREAIQSLSGRNAPIDLISLNAELKRRGHLAEIGGEAFVAELACETCSTASIKHHAEILRDMATRRRLEKLGKEIIQRVHDQTPTEDIIRAIDQAILTAQPASSWTHVQDAIRPTLDGIEAAYVGGSGPGLSTGLVDLDRKINGLNPGNLIIVAGRPGTGKTSLAAGAGLEAGKVGVVGFFTLEMSTTEMVKRLLAIKGKNLSVSRLDRGALSGDGWISLATTAEEIGSLNFYLCDEGNLTADGLRRKALALKRAHGLDLLVVDYLQLMTTDRRAENRVVGMTEISRSLKLLAKELSIPVVALSQLNRLCEGRPDKRPLLSDLRETGAIEQDADVVLFIYRDELYNEETPDRGIAEIIVRKNRHGPSGEVRVSWIGERTAFKDLSMRLP